MAWLRSALPPLQGWGHSSISCIPVSHLTLRPTSLTLHPAHTPHPTALSLHPTSLPEAEAGEAQQPGAQLAVVPAAGAARGGCTHPVGAFQAAASLLLARFCFSLKYVTIISIKAFFSGALLFEENRPPSEDPAAWVEHSPLLITTSLRADFLAISAARAQQRSFVCSQP